MSGGWFIRSNLSPGHFTSGGKLLRDSTAKRQPQTLVTAVSATIEMESYLQPKPSRIAQVEPEKGTEPVIAAIQHQQTALWSTLDKVMERLDKLEMKTQEPPKGPSVGPVSEA